MMTQIDVKKEGNWLVINGEHYNIREDDAGNIIFKKVPKNEFDEITHLVKEIGDKLESSVSPRMILDDALADISIYELKKIHKSLFKQKKKPEVKHGCLQIKVGKSIVQLR